MRPLCTTGKQIVIAKVQPAQPSSGMRVADWGVWSSDPDPVRDVVGGAPGLVSSAAGVSPKQPVTARCGRQGRTNELYVSLERTSRRSDMAGLWVYYGSGRRTFVQYQFLLCASKACGPAPVPKSVKPPGGSTNS
jgi:hypothetical protein